jgi:hypothetical protein
LRFKRNDTSIVGIQLHRDGVPELPQASSTLTFGVKSKNNFGGNFLTSATSFTLATTAVATDQGDSDFNYQAVSFNTAEIDALMDDALPEIEAMGEIEIDVGGAGQLFSSRTISVIIENDIVRGDEGANTVANPIPDAQELIRWKSSGATAAFSSLTGGTSTDLDSLPTTALPIGVLAAVLDEDGADTLRFYRLDSSTAAEASPNTIRPDDYATTTNERVWRLVASNALGLATELTIDTGAVTLSGSHGIHTIDTEGDAASDDLDTITGGAEGDQIIIYPANDARSVVIKHGTGNITTFDGTDLTLDTDDHIALLIYTGGGWKVIANSAGGGAGMSDLVDDTTPQLGGMLDVNGNAIGDGTLELVKFAETGSAVNEITITNAATAGSPSVTATGDDANIDLTLDGKGTGTVKTLSSNLDVTGNIVVSGTVDGRDLATDGGKLDGIEAAADVTDATNVDAAGAVMNSDTSTASMGFVVDEDTMSSDSATKVPTQQSVKAYVDASAGGLTWIRQTTSTTIVAGNGYLSRGAALVFTLPSSPTLGQTFRIVGLTNSWKIAQPASTNIFFGNLTTTTGTGGYIQSTDANDCVELVCSGVAATEGADWWSVVSSIGNITVA